MPLGFGDLLAKRELIGTGPWCPPPPARHKIRLFVTSPSQVLGIGLVAVKRSDQSPVLALSMVVESTGSNHLPLRAMLSHAVRLNFAGSGSLITLPSEDSLVFT